MTWNRQKKQRHAHVSRDLDRQRERFARTQRARQQQPRHQPAEPSTKPAEQKADPTR